MCKGPKVCFSEGSCNQADPFIAAQGILGCPWQSWGIGKRSYLKWHSTLVVVSGVTQRDISKSMKSRVAMTSSILKQNPRRLMKTLLPAILVPLEYFPWTSCPIRLSQRLFSEYLSYLDDKVASSPNYQLPIEVHCIFLLVDFYNIISS